MITILPKEHSTLQSLTSSDFFPTSISFIIMIWKTSNVDNMYLNKSFKSQQAHIKSLFPPTQLYSLTHSLNHLCLPSFSFIGRRLQSNKPSCITSHRKHTQSTKHSCSPAVGDADQLQWGSAGARETTVVIAGSLVSKTELCPPSTLSLSARSASTTETNPFKHPNTQWK